MFMSHGSSYLLANQKEYERLAKIYSEQFTEAFNGLRMKDVELEATEHQNNLSDDEAY
jgi:hypothetical protein